MCRSTTPCCCPARPPPKLMVGSTGSRVLAAALPHVDAWNTWFDWFGNTPGGFAARNAEVDDLARRAGRDPDSLERSACLLVALDPSSGSGRTIRRPRR